jgi:hypothetical protein
MQMITSRTTTTPQPESIVVHSPVNAAIIVMNHSEGVVGPNPATRPAAEDGLVIRG